MSEDGTSDVEATPIRYSPARSAPREMKATVACGCVAVLAYGQVDILPRRRDAHAH